MTKKQWIGESPDTVYLYPTMLCNLKCKMCYSGGHMDKKRAEDEELSFEEYKLLIEGLYNRGVRKFDISGGEPLLRNDILEIFKFIKSFPDTILYVVCNGTLLESRMASMNSCLDIIDRLYVSFDSPNAKEHNLIRGNSRAFQDAIKGVDALKGEQFDSLGINFVVMNQNRKQIEDVLEMALRVGAVYINLLRLMDVSERGALSEENLGLEEYAETYLTALKWIEKKAGEGFDKKFEATLVLPGFCFEDISKIRSRTHSYRKMKLELQFDPMMGCPAFGNGLVITASGKTTGCTATIAIPELYTGDIHDSPLEAILCKHKEMRGLIMDREEILKATEPCASCSFWRYCRGGCPASAYHYYGTMLRSDPTCIKI